MNNKVTMRVKTPKQNVYVAVIEDRHADVEIEIFTSPDDAINYIDTELAKLKIDSEDIVVEFMPEVLYYVSYSIEGDHAYVIERDIKV